MKRRVLMFSVKKKFMFLGLFVIAVLTTVNFNSQCLYAGEAIITVDGNSEGRVFEGIGTLSAGASTRLLIDYPEPYRSDILDYLFKPYFGAAQHHIKVEIGSDMNSTIGTEPAHARTRQEMKNPDFERGYEYWLMAEAKKRNPAVMTDMLEWGAPYWFKNDYGHVTAFFSRDNAEFISSALKGAKTRWGVDVDYTGVWNEGHYSRYPQKDIIDWIVNVYRPVLDRDGLQDVEVVGLDTNHDQWKIADWMNDDRKLFDTVDIIGEHYPGCATSAEAKKSGKRLWANEDAWVDGSWAGGISMTKVCNRNYIDGKMTKTISWATINSFFYFMWNCGYPGKMMANTPWSGHYEVTPAIWAMAHTTQFAQPGWRYLDSGCGYIDPARKIGSYVTFKDPESDHYSVVIETSGTPDSKVELKLSPEVNGGKVYVWKSDSKEQFVMIDTLIPVDGKISLDVKTNAIYSLTTTTGQKKGVAANEIPEDTPFPMPYSADFEKYKAGKTARYFSDYVGGFETYRGANGSMVLRQVTPKRGIDWTYGGNVYPHTLVGDSGWRNYEVQCDVYLETSESAALYGRVNAVDRGGVPPKGYGLYIYSSGKWELKYYKELIAEGAFAIKAKKWYNVKLRFSGKQLEGFIDDEKVITAIADKSDSGAIGAGCAWGFAQFDNFQVMPHELDQSFVSSVNIQVSAQPDSKANPAKNLLKSDKKLVYSAGFAEGGRDFEAVYKLRRPFKVSGITYLPVQDNKLDGALLNYTVALSDDGKEYTEAAAGKFKKNKDRKFVSFEPKFAKYVKITATDFAGGSTVSGAELSLMHIDTTLRIPPENMKVKVESVYPGYPGENMLDDDDKTLWHSASAIPMNVDIDLGGKHTISKFSYTPAAAGNGNVLRYKLHGSIDGKTYSLIHEGSFNKAHIRKEVEFATTTASHIRFEIIETTTTDSGWANIASIDFYNSQVLAEAVKIYSKDDIDEITEKGGTLKMFTKITPEYSDSKQVVWKVFDSGMRGTKTAKITADGVLSASANGMYKVQAKTIDGSEVVDVFTVNISGQGE